MTKLAVLVSGSGSNLEAMIEQRVPIGLVLADKPCAALGIAAKANIPFVVIDRTHFGYGLSVDWNRKHFTDSIRAQLEVRGIDLVAMAGFMTILHDDMFTDYLGWILNIHPALLPDFKGAHAVRDALVAGVKTTGTTVHIATERLDDERFIIRQAIVPVLDGDSEDVLHERIKVQERQLYPKVLLDIFSGAITLRDIKEHV